MSATPNENSVPPDLTSTLDEELINLSAGTELDEDALTVLSRATPTRLVVIGGPVASGKTTLLTSIYELFQWGKLEGYVFCRSATLPGFESRCYLARTASGGEKAKTGRTPMEEGATYLHLRAASSTGRHPPTDLVFTDLSGEMFEHACDSVEGCRRLAFLQRADHFVLMLDGKKLATKNLRWAIVQRGRSLLRSGIDSGMIGPGTFVDVVFAKCDSYPNGGAEAAGLKTFCDGVRKDFLEEFGGRVGRLKFGEIAARSESTAPSPKEFGFGVSELFDRWAASSPRDKPVRLSSSVAAGDRESEQFQPRVMGD